MKLLFASLLLNALFLPAANADGGGFVDKLKSFFSRSLGLTTSVASGTAQADVPPKPKGNCANVAAFGWRITQRIGPGIYEIVTAEGHTNCWYSRSIPYLQGSAKANCLPGTPATTAILVTDGDQFTKSGRIPWPFWIDEGATKETRELALTNGFTKKFEVYRESYACTYWKAVEEKEAKDSEEKARAEVKRSVVSVDSAEEQNAEPPKPKKHAPKKIPKREPEVDIYETDHY